MKREADGDRVAGRAGATDGRARRRIRVALVDDEHLVRAGLKLILEAEDDIEVACEAGDGEEAVRLVKECDPDVVLMDI